jgi:hypothetical protein
MRLLVAVKLLLEFPDALLLRVDKESLLGDDEAGRARLE